MSIKNLSRRRFLKTTAVVGGGLVVGFSLFGLSDEPLPVVTEPGGLVPNAFLQFTADNRIIFYCPRDEMGQGVMTGLATVIGEELDVSPHSMEIVHCEVHSDYANPAMGIQVTGGSTSINAHYMPLRQVGADTRALILAAAAKDLNASLGELNTEDGQVLYQGQTYPYGRFIATAREMDPVTGAPLRRQSEFRYIGQLSRRTDALAKVTGQADYGLDARVEGMQYAVLVRSPVFGAQLLSYDDSAVLRRPGVTAVVAISNGVAIVADSYWHARDAASQLSVQWEDTPRSSLTSEQQRFELIAALDSDDEATAVDEGDIQLGLADARAQIEGEYWTPYLAHAPMEPMNALVRLGDNDAEIWLGIQSAQAAQNLVSRVSGIPTENIVVHNLFLGGGFGRRGVATHVVEATEIAMAVGTPIKLMWSREDDIQSGFYRPASIARVRAAVDSNGVISAWDVKRAGGDITPGTIKNLLPAIFPSLPTGLANGVSSTVGFLFSNLSPDSSSVEGLHENYNLTNVQVKNSSIDHGVPVTFWRSVGHSNNAFVTESAMDELAIAADLDPVELRLKNTGDNPRLNNVIRIAGELMREMQLPDGHHLGFASHGSFLTDVAQVAQVSVEAGKIRVHKVLCVVDCGLAVNPDIVRTQMEGGIIFGLTAALYGELTLEAGRVKQSNFHDYPMLRMDEAPEIVVIIVDSKTEPTGVGEPSVPPIAPAVANAVFRATGQRLRDLPLRLVV